jgi:diadenosine tetraphosphate (Ap4A) HIT family hydrolase
MNRRSSVGIAGTWNFSLHQRVQNGSGAHPASYPMGTRVSFPGGKAARGVKLTTHLHIVPRSKNEWNYTSTPATCLHGMVLS